MNPDLLIAVAVFLAVMAAVLFAVFSGYGVADLVSD